jgi:hypothetical protein
MEPDQSRPEGWCRRLPESGLGGLYDNDIRLGSLCLLDTKPRSFSLGERAELHMLADYVVSVITSRALGLAEPDISPALAC